MISRIVLGIAMVLAVAGAVPSSAHADWDDRPDPSEFEQELAPNGYWVDEPQFGRVWRPYVDWGWQPYVDGRWIWTSYGWTWTTDLPWGWTFHYGRWGFSNLYGWVWTPGVVWGPAWVDWYWGDGFVGWVPIGPAGFAVIPSYWIYVHDYSFCAPRINNVVVVQNRLPNYIVHHRQYGWGARHAPDFRDIEHVSRHRIEQVTERPPQSVAPWVKHRIDRGERVRERVADRGGERIIEHSGGTLSDGRNRPRVADDGGWGRQRDRNRDDGDNRRLGHDGPGDSPRLGTRERYDGGARIIERDPSGGSMRHDVPDDRSGFSNGAAGRRTEIDRTPPPPADGRTMRPRVDNAPQTWSHQSARPPATASQPPTMGPSTPTYHGGGAPGGPTMSHGSGGAPSAPATSGGGSHGGGMQHGGSAGGWAQGGSGGFGAGSGGNR